MTAPVPMRNLGNQVKSNQPLLMRSVAPGGAFRRVAVPAPAFPDTRTTAPVSSPRPLRARRAKRVRLIRRSEPFLLMAAACALVALLATLYLTEDNKAALMTYQINDLQGQQSTLLRTQGDLKLQLEQLAALQRIQAEVVAQGMVPAPPTATTYIKLSPAVDTVAPPPALARSQP
ncbi:MAG: hypothetical protein ACR2JY_17210 [Chloroflexota bacterium]